MDDLNFRSTVIDKLIKQCEQSKLVSFAYQDAMFSIRFSKIDGQTNHSANVIEKVTIGNASESNISTFGNDSCEYAIASISQMDKKDNEGIVTITSPFVGTVEFSNKIKLGGNDIHISKGDVICSVEAMKIYNDIKAPTSGSIVEIFAKDCELIEYEQPILKIRVDKNE